MRNSVESPYKHLVIFVYLGLKLLDFYFQRQPKQVLDQGEVLPPPLQVDPHPV